MADKKPNGVNGARGDCDFGVQPDPSAYEQYAHTFAEWQNTWDRTRWIGMGTTVEYPHNRGAYEEQVDEAQGRKTDGDRY